MAKKKRILPNIGQSVIEAGSAHGLQLALEAFFREKDLGAEDIIAASYFVQPGEKFGEGNLRSDSYHACLLLYRTGS